mgnify:CR=1 FL=1
MYAEDWEKGQEERVLTVGTAERSHGEGSGHGGEDGEVQSSSGWWMATGRTKEKIKIKKREMDSMHCTGGTSKSDDGLALQYGI